ncbi:MAG: universal stress protein [Magnetovibrionaceae bacterium]
MYKSILSTLDGTAESRSAAQTAGLLAKHFGAKLTLLHMVADARDAVPLVGEGMSGALIDEIVKATEEDAKRRLDSAEADRDSLSLEDADWRVLSGREDEEVALRGRLADLTVLSRPGGAQETSANLTLHAALFETGRPVLVVPETPMATLPKRIAISWNGSAQASRALAAALPFLIVAEKVVVLNAKADVAEPVCCEALAGYLAAHGIKADVDSFQPSGVAVGADILSHAAHQQADMLVMGAYTHSRMRQLILGGVTSHVLEHAELPVLMAH